MKSDDVVGRVKTFEAIVKGHNIPKPGIPESFKVIIKELQSLGLDVKVLDKDNEEIDLKQTFDDDDDVGLPRMGDDDTLEMEYVKDEEEIGEHYQPEEMEPDESESIFEADEVFGLDDDDLFDDKL